MEVFPFKCMALFIGYGPRHISGVFCLVFQLLASWLTQSVGFWTGSMQNDIKVKSIIHFNSFSNLGFKVRGIFLMGYYYMYRDYVIHDLSMILMWYGT